MMKRRRFLLLAGAIILAALMVSGVALAQSAGPLSPGAALNTGFTYQGRLIQNGDPVSDTCDFRFTLYDAADGDPVGTPQDKPDEPVSDGYFTVGNLDFGTGVFTGDARWLGVEVDCEGDGSYTDLGRQELTAAPYALHAASTAALHGQPISTTAPGNDQVLKWDGSHWVPADDELGGGGTGDISAVYAGEGLGGGGSSGPVTLTVAFTGSGSLPYVPHSDHTHSGGDITGAVPTATLAMSATQAPWSGLTGVPPGFADGVDDEATVVSGTNVLAGEGLDRVSDSDSVTLSVDFAGNGTATTVARSDHAHDDRYYTQGQLDTSGGGGQVHWDNVISVPADLGITYTAGTGLALSDHTFSINPTYRLPQGCTGGEIAEWNSTAGIWECGSDDTGGGAAAWLLTGNAGTDPATHFLGTTDATSLTLAVSSTAALRLEPTSGTPNVIGGYSGNGASAGVYGATIGGGGHTSDPNHVVANYGTVGGGRGNETVNVYDTVSGGTGNTASGTGATVGGGSGNTASGLYGTVPGGSLNVAEGDHSFAAGRQAQALHDGTFVWNESSGSLQSTGPDQFLVRSTGGVTFTTDSAPFHINGKPVYQPTNVVVVAASGGDTTSVQAAIDSITNAAADNPYLVWVAPGVYNESVTMKPYVHLQGAGQEATVISSTTTTSDWPPTIGTLVLADHVSLRDLTVTNLGTGDRNVALLATDGTTQTLIADTTAQAQGAGSYNYGIFLTGSETGVTLQHVTGLGENGTSNYGLYNESGADAILHGGSFTGREGAQCWGINNTNSTLEAEGVTALGEGTSSSIGMANRSSGNAVLRGGSFMGRGGDNAKGIYTDSSATLEAKEVTALGWDATTTNVGLRTISSGNTVLRGGSFTGRGGVEASGIYNNSTPLETENVTALGEGGTSSSKGFYNNSATTAMHGGSFTGRGGEISYGIANVSGATLETKSIIVLATEATTDTYGLYNVGGSGATVHGGSFTANGGINARGIHIEDSGTTLEAESITAAGENASSSNYGLYNDSADATLRGSSFTGRGENSAFGIYNYDSSATLEAEGITALGENGTTSDYGYGLYNGYGTVTLRGGSFTGHGGGYARGILNYGSGVMGATLEAENITALAESGFIQNYGLENSGTATATLRGGSFIGRDNVTRGIYTHGSGSILDAQRITALGENGSTNYGLRIADGTATVTQGVLEGSTRAVVQVSGAITVSNSRLVGGAANVGVTCVAVSRGANWSQNSCP